MADVSLLSLFEHEPQPMSVVTASNNVRIGLCMVLWGLDFANIRSFGVNFLRGGSKSRDLEPPYVQMKLIRT